MLLSEILPRVAAMQPLTQALVMDSFSVTYAELYDGASRLASAFSDLGVHAGDRVALLGENYHLIIAEHAAVALGAIPFAVNMRLEDPEMESVLLDGDPIVAVCDATGIEILQRINPPGVRFIIACIENTEYSSLSALIQSHSPVKQWFKGNPDDVSLIIYTGGTTGQPRGVMHTHRSIMQWTNMNPHQRLAIAPGNKTLLFNLAHITGQYTVWTTTLSASCLILAPRYPLSAKDVLGMVDVHRLKFLGFTGQLLHDFVSLPDLDSHDLSCVDLVVHGGSPTSRHTLRKTVQVLPQATVAELYGTTESGLCITGHFINPWVQQDALEERMDSVGSTSLLSSLGQFPYEIQILDDTGCPVAPRVAGEVVCKGNLVMKGYWRNPVATVETIRDGWLHTGDIGWLDEDGYLYLCDRKKDMIIVNGLNVYSIEVENLLARHPAIDEVAVVSAPRGDEGEDMVAVVKVKSGHVVALDEIRRFCSGQIAEYKLPTRLHLVDNLPRTGVDKLNKQEIRNWFWDGTGRRVH